jgi:hypothetical protein
MTTKPLCEELNKLNAEAIAAFAEAKRIRRQRDISFHEDAELSRDGHRRIDALVKHLLAGHDGEPCPNGDRPIISIATSAQNIANRCMSGFLSGFPNLCSPES